MNGSIYIHVPFCKKKCHYCSFYVIRSRSAGFDLYTEALIQEIQQRKTIFDSLSSIYFGGGTPTQLPLEHMQRIMNALDLSGEITLEANPEDLDLIKLKAYRQMGFNRLSIGAQSFDNSELIALGRTHQESQTQKCIAWAREAGFNNISIDLMVDLPNQTQKSLQKTLRVIELLNIEHISLYNLQIEKNSLFWAKRQEMDLPNEELSLSLYQKSIEALKSFGYERYEISAFCRPGKESIHNTGYWLGRAFVGMGPGAFSYLNGRRMRNVRNLAKWSQGVQENRATYDFDEKLESMAHQKEMLVVALRMTKGIDLRQWSHLPAETMKNLEDQIAQGYLQKADTQVKLSEKGFLFYDTLASNLI